MKTDARGAAIERRGEPVHDAVWEYRSLTAELHADLTAHGVDGWELVSVVPGPHDPLTAVYYFKRRRL